MNNKYPKYPKYTPEPEPYTAGTWTLSFSGGNVISAGGSILAHVGRTENAARIIACVNACQDFSDEELANGVLTVDFTKGVTP